MWMKLFRVGPKKPRRAQEALSFLWEAGPAVCVKYCSSRHNRTNNTALTELTPIPVPSPQESTRHLERGTHLGLAGTLKTIQLTPHFARAMLSLSGLPFNRETEFEREHVFAFAKPSSHLDRRQIV